MSGNAKKKFLLSTMALALLAGGALVVHYGTSGSASAQGAQQEAPPMPVPVVDIQKKPVQLWKEFSGRLNAVDYVEIRPQVSGIIEKVNFQDGQIVKQGDVLINIDPRPYEAAAAQARAELASAREDAQYAQKELARAEELLQSGAISRQGYDQRVNSQKTNKSNISAAEARLKAALVDLDHASIKAPISGRVSRAEITVGNLVNAASAPLLTSIVSDKDIYGDFEVDEQTYLRFVRARAGQTVEGEQAIPVRMTLVEDKKEYTGKIQSFDNQINASSGTIRARAIFANDDAALLPGMFVKVRIGSPSQDNVMTVPEKAVLTDQSRKFVYVVDNGAATYREVKLGDTVDNERVVMSGLQPGDKVIIDNLMKIRPGAKVQAMTPEQIDQMKAQMAQQAQQGQGGGEAKNDKKADEKKADAPAAGGADAPADGDKAEPKAIPFEDPAAKGEQAPAPQQTPAQE